ncbi:MAG: pyruvate, phosphate dikinase [Caldilinea sp.]|nr:pyruvate, phosphate dikinase [Caldilinea sp.]MCB0146384.1 pyruvate, phosphate dikinase [Caldilineaceae bacterium]MCB0048851.1 pyruvate, phosphate dikinase [Caldilinea sp.]MCB9118185.1 pyruvate, phosphate dikinase [Caldilineaceae bacterium]MCB9123353.1 pyruvate, phosphate dikinase [Caldilineaceae bacterium]
MSALVSEEKQAGTAGQKQWVFLFNELDKAEAACNAKKWDDVRSFLGGKGANLFEMTRLELPVPPGFTVSTEACNAYLAANHELPEGMWDQEVAAMHAVEKQVGKTFGDPNNPLFVSCRSGAKFSMPGMMDTVLNIGLNDETAEGLIKLTDDARFVYDSYRRLIQMFGSVVMGVADEPFEEVIAEQKKKSGIKNDVDLTAADWQEIIERFKALVKAYKGIDFPQDPYKQLEMATRAVFNSWFGKRAIDYRNATGIRHDLGTAVNIVTMVFGNMGDDSATGVAFTRNPVDGTKELYGDFLINAQGEDVVAGIRNTLPIARLKVDMPEAFDQFMDIVTKLENHFQDMQDVEFTIEHGKLWMLQTRNGKRTARAAIKMAVDMTDEGLIKKSEAVMRVTPEQVDQLLHPQFSAETKQKSRSEGALLVPKAVNASPGAAVGMAVFDADTADEWGKAGKAVIMVRPETKPDDVHGMIAAKGILTSRGGATSHAAVVARQFGTPAVCGAEELEIDVEHRMMHVNIDDTQIEIREGDWISLDGGTGEVFLGKLATQDPDFENEVELNTLLNWADEIRTLGVWANADYPKDAERARRYGAEGIGLCRTEHMFFEEERLPVVQEMIMATSKARRLSALERLLPVQRGDFEGIFRAMDGLPVIIRLLDPPLHEFLPGYNDLVSDLADLKVRLQHYHTLSEIDTALGQVRQKEDILNRVKVLSEANPMLGLRGDRLSVVMPEITEMQVRAILEAAIHVKKEGVDVHPEIMVPLAGHANELKYVKEIVDRIAAEVFAESGTTVDFKYGSMIEIPRAALTADELAEYAEFYSFGTNDLTQTTFGMSRDDAESKFLMEYTEKGILPTNPFQQLDRGGVGKLIEMTVKLGRTTRPEMHMGICGEHGGDPNSIEFCHMAGLNYVSCSPFRVPIARLAAAQAAVSHG